MADKHVLIVEVDGSLDWYLSSLCYDLGFDVAISSNGLHALICARENKPDLILLDADAAGSYW